MTISFTKVLLLLTSAVALTTANPIPDEAHNTTSADMGILAKPDFFCNDNELSKKCRGPPYNFRCTNDNHINYDEPYYQCRDKTRCSCHYPCNNIKIC
ncbi:unnamed protein product [Fusarium graminearum]|nr:unnamed protein product [Fusarium graminearum]CAG1976533.1 unnamed protein product [Fusarium graminearum]CZS79270.1 unnamed protein product [Fusarium graminearum]